MLCWVCRLNRGGFPPPGALNNTVPSKLAEMVSISKNQADGNHFFQPVDIANKTNRVRVSEE